MLLRKMNAIVSLLTTILLLNHAINMAVWMLSMGDAMQRASVVPRMLAVLMLLHAFISIYFAFSGHENCEKRKVKSYLRMNGAAIFQRVSGILLIVFTALHIAGASGAMQPPFLVHAIVLPIFFSFALAHAAVSTSRAFITLGIGNAKFVKGVRIVIGLICFATLVADIWGFYLYVC